MDIKNDKIIENIESEYRTDLYVGINNIRHMSIDDLMKIPGRGVLVDKEQDIYSNDLPRKERKSYLNGL